MSKKLFIIKFGGSVITDKSASNFMPRKRHINAIAQNIACAFNPQIHHLIVIHGAGSAGHALAKKHMLTKGSHGNDIKERACMEIQKNIHTLQDIIAHAFARNTLPVEVIRTQDVCTNMAGVFTTIDDMPVHRALAHNAIPLLSGAIVPDTRWRHSVLSGDTLCTHYARTIPTHIIAYASDVDGIYTDNPHTNPTKARLLTEISLTDISETATRMTIGKAHTTDVTGGMAGKVRAFASLRATQHKPTIIVFNGTVSKNFSHLLRNDHTLTCTRIITRTHRHKS